MNIGVLHWYKLKVEVINYPRPDKCGFVSLSIPFTLRPRYRPGMFGIQAEEGWPCNQTEANQYGERLQAAIKKRLVEDGLPIPKTPNEFDDELQLAAFRKLNDPNQVAIYKLFPLKHSVVQAYMEWDMKLTNRQTGL